MKKANNDMIWWLCSALLVCLLMFGCPHRSHAAEIGMVQTTGTPTCQDAKEDLLAVSIRLHALKDEFKAETNQSLRLVIKEEAKAVARLGRKIIMFMNEQCRDA